MLRSFVYCIFLSTLKNSNMYCDDPFLDFPKTNIYNLIKDFKISKIILKNFKQELG